MAARASLVPQSMSIREWPATVYPFCSKRARYIIRQHRKSLIAAGALTRIGREVVVLGEQYARWLEQQKPKAADYAFHGTPIHAPKALAKAKEPA